jgi:hypothetical protein
MELSKFDLRKAYSAEGAFVMGGLFFFALAWVTDLVEHLPLLADPGHIHGALGDPFVRLNVPTMGIALIAFALGLYVVEHHRDRTHLLAYVAGLLILTDGIAHLFAVDDHLDIPLYVVGFAILGLVQIGGGILFPFLPRSWDKYWLLLIVVIIAVFVVSRYAALPPLWNVEEVDGLGIASKIIEVLSLVPLYALVRGGKPSSTPPSNARAAEP